MKEICQRDICTGCMACYNACNKNAIELITDKEGFLHPVINEKLCIKCNLCYKICPINSEFNRFHKPIKIYSGWSNDEKIRISSSSGGAFTEIAKLIIKQGGVVFGVSMNKNIEAEHIYVENETDLNLLIGSKYVQSHIGKSFRQVKEFLKQGRKVLFSGTPCQIAGLKNYLNKDYENLYTIDLICHGVPSPRVFNDYKQYIEYKIHNKIQQIHFRCKKSSWIFYNIGIKSCSEKNIDEQKYSYIGEYYSDPYIRAFLRDYILRPSCYNCKFTSMYRVGDFTIADWWGYKATSNKDAKFEQKGVSLIMCNTDKSIEMATNLNMDLKERTSDEALRTNQSLKKPFTLPIQRDAFWIDYENLSFQEMIEKWMYPESIPMSTYIRIYQHKKKLLYNIFKQYERIMNKIGLKKLIIRKQAK